MFNIALFTALAKGVVLVGGTTISAYVAYNTLPGPKLESMLSKMFKSGSVYKPITKFSLDGKKYEVKIYPSIKRSKVHKDRTQIVFSVPDGMNPIEITSRIWLFKQVFGEKIEVTGNSKTFMLEVYKVDMKTFDYNLEEIQDEVIGYNLPILAGQTRKGYVVYDMCEHPHLLVAGETGSGKSVQLRSILTTLITCAGDKVDLYCADLKRSEFHLFRGIAKTVDVEPINLQSTLLQLNKEMKKRGDLLDRNEMANINDLPDDIKPKYIVLAIDEVSLLRKEKDIMKIVEDISSIGRALGVFLILSMQRPDHHILDGKLKNNLTVRMAFRHADEINSHITIGSGEAAHIKQSQKGRFYLSLEELREVQSPLLELAKAKSILSPYKNKPVEVFVEEDVEEQELWEDFIEFGGLDDANKG